MSLDEVVPPVGCPVRTGDNALLFEDVPDRLAADLLDAEFPEFADNPGVSESRRFGDLDHQLTQFSGLPLASLGVLLSVRLSLLSQPTVERRWADDRQ
ncbi:hypothetical protein SH668x_000107 [Planctomicrobium sp. SH668]|uniref:hypothetical protein n=1 Tax=Planctomicrobium sp. SH668 TaxID=3448126 RepID=UPI003F5C98E5